MRPLARLWVPARACWWRTASPTHVRPLSTASDALKTLLPGEKFASHEELYKFSIEQPDTFWGGIARSQLRWHKEFTTVSNCDMSKGMFEWFKDGQLNAAINCVDRHVEAHPDQVALIWEKDEPQCEVMVTYKELSEMVNRLSNVLLRCDVKPNDVVALYMPVCPMAVAAMLACARVGAIHSVIFAGFSPEAVASRIQDANAVCVVTADEGIRGGKHIPLKATVDKALAKGCPSVKNVLLYRDELSWPEAETLMANESTECPAVIRNAEDYLFLLYTSGSTGKPKGLAHSTAGYLSYAGITQKLVFDYHPGDIFGCVADIGWITGHTYVVYGPLVNGGTTVLFESTPTYPDPSRYWEVVERIGVNQFYGAPTAIRLLLRYEDEWVLKHDRSSLRTLGSVGEPINVEAWEWYHKVPGDGKCTVVDTWWQTETGGICLAPRPAEASSEILPGKPMRPMLGISPIICDDKAKEVADPDEPGALCLKTPWPGMARTIYGDHERFISTYFAPFPGYYFTGDGASRDAKGYYQITGRMDDVINVTGHRLGTAEVETALAEHPDVAESAVVGFPHPLKGEGVYAYVILKENVSTPEDQLSKELKAMVKKKISGFAVPEYIVFNHGLPKTRSGKIMRRILRKVASGDHHDLGDTSTLADPSVVDAIKDKHNKMPKTHH